MTRAESGEPERDAASPGPLPQSGAGPKFPAGTTAEDRVCWVCGGATLYRHCRIVCSNCGFTRDCSDP